MPEPKEETVADVLVESLDNMFSRLMFYPLVRFRDNFLSHDFEVRRFTNVELLKAIDVMRDDSAILQVEIARIAAAHAREIAVLQAEVARLKALIEGWPQRCACDAPEHLVEEVTICAGCGGYRP
jgi:uncharacterized small protein (DUF1192 family)